MASRWKMLRRRILRTLSTTVVLSFLCWIGPASELRGWALIDNTDYSECFFWYHSVPRAIGWPIFVAIAAGVVGAVLAAWYRSVLLVPTIVTTGMVVVWAGPFVRDNGCFPAAEVGWYGHQLVRVPRCLDLELSAHPELGAWGGLWLECSDNTSKKSGVFVAWPVQLLGDPTRPDSAWRPSSTPQSAMEGAPPSPMR